MATQQKSIEEQQVKEAVERFAYNRYGHLIRSDIQRDWDDEELARMAITDDGYLKISIEGLNAEPSEDGLTWYVEATLFFLVDEGEDIEGSTDTYECYRGADGEWVVDWHSS